MSTTDLNNPAHIGHSNYLISTNGKQAEQIFYPGTPLPESVRSELLDIGYLNTTEQCGFITEDFDIVPVQNSHLEPRTNFFMSDEEVMVIAHEIYEIRESKIIGIYHTHPNQYPWPSPRDIVGWPNPALAWRYFLVTRGDVTEWRLIGD